MMQQARGPAWVRPVVDYGPLIAFFAAYMTHGLFVATAVIVAVTIAGLALSVATTRTIPRMPLITAVLVTVFGGLTLWLNDPAFIKMKPTIVEALFAVVLGGGLLMDKPLLRPVLGMALPWALTHRGWTVLTARWAAFFASLAVLNELVWRTQPTDVWVTFKVFGILALTLGFAVAQVPLLTRYRVEDEEAAG